MYWGPAQSIDLSPHSGSALKVSGICLPVYQIIWTFSNAIVHILIVTNGPLLKNNAAIWSHCQITKLVCQVNVYTLNLEGMSSSSRRDRTQKIHFRRFFLQNFELGSSSSSGVNGFQKFAVEANFFAPKPTVEVDFLTVRHDAKARLETLTGR